VLHLDGEDNGLIFRNLNVMASPFFVARATASFDGTQARTASMWRAQGSRSVPMLEDIYQKPDAATLRSLHARRQQLE